VDDWRMLAVAVPTFLAFGFVVAVILYCTRPR
jgi:hypothetical protein